MRQFLTPLLWFSAIGCGLMAGVYFAFSTFVMTSLARLGPAGATMMNAFIADIGTSLFMPVFLLTTLTSAALAVMAMFRWGHVRTIASTGSFVMFVLALILTRR